MPQSPKPSRVEGPLRRTAPWGIQVGKLDGTSASWNRVPSGAGEAAGSRASFGEEVPTL